MKNIFLAISLFAVAAGCRSDQASILLDTVDVMGTDPEDVWTRNHEMAILSDYIYQLRNPDKGFIPWSDQEHKDFKATGYQLLYFEQKNGEYAFFIQPKSGRIAVVFRGTNVGKPFDLLTNADFPLSTFDRMRPQSGKVANGYLKRWQHHKGNIIFTLQKFMDLYDYLNPHVVFAGHSLGGAVAIIAGVDLFQNGLNASIFSFSVPHFADEAFAQHTANLVKNGLFIVSHEIDGDPIINTVRPAQNPVAGLDLGSDRMNHFIYDYDVKKPMEAHSIKHVKSRIKHSPAQHQKAFYKFYESRPLRGRFGCMPRL